MESAQLPMALWSLNIFSLFFVANDGTVKNDRDGGKGRRRQKDRLTKSFKLNSSSSFRTRIREFCLFESNFDTSNGGCRREE